jgi:hypothetical protein
MANDIVRLPQPKARFSTYWSEFARVFARYTTRQFDRIKYSYMESWTLRETGEQFNIYSNKEMRDYNVMEYKRRNGSTRTSFYVLPEDM